MFTGIFLSMHIVTILNFVYLAFFFLPFLVFKNFNNFYKVKFKIVWVIFIVIFIKFTIEIILRAETGLFNRSSYNACQYKINMKILKTFKGQICY